MAGQSVVIGFVARLAPSNEWRHLPLELRIVVADLQQLCKPGVTEIAGRWQRGVIPQVAAQVELSVQADRELAGDSALVSSLAHNFSLYAGVHTLPCKIAQLFQSGWVDVLELALDVPNCLLIKGPTIFL